MEHAEEFSIEQTRTGYWSVRRGAVHVSGATTQRGAEAERELLRRLSRARERRSAARYRVPPVSRILSAPGR
jgi:hypothetical protein